MSYRPVVSDHAGFARHASRPAIIIALRKTETALAEARREQKWLADLLMKRQAQILTGEPWCMGDHRSCVHPGPVPTSQARS